MNKIILTAAAALLVSAGAAFAGIGDYAPATAPTVDQTTTASISNNQNSELKTLLDSNVKVQSSDRGVFGR
jgi:hypothetical protein